jgi:Uma2 family endonuclease
MEQGPRRHRITVEEYYRMAEVGLLAPDARVELIEGEIIDMPPSGSRHTGTVSLLGRLLERAVGDRAIVRCQAAVVLGEFSQPEPDVALVVPNSDFYRQRHPVAGDTLLVIEVSETSFRYDRQTKLQLYARHSIPEVWIVDLKGGLLHVFRNPSGITYSEAVTTDELGAVSVMACPDVSVDLSALLP